MLASKKCNGMAYLVRPQQRFFGQYDTPDVELSRGFADWFRLQRVSSVANLPTANLRFRKPRTETFQDHYTRPLPQNQDLFQSDVAQNIHTARSSFPLQMHSLGLNESPVTRSKATIWDEFKRLYTTEVLAFTMSKSTLFTLIFSFMFLGCVFFLSGFFTATNIYLEKHGTHKSRQHLPSETAMLQGRPEKTINMGTSLENRVPKAYREQSGVQMNQYRRPSQHIEQEIAKSESYRH